MRKQDERVRERNRERQRQRQGVRDSGNDEGQGESKNIKMNLIWEILSMVVLIHACLRVYQLFSHHGGQILP